jgi:acetyl esterase
MSQDWLVQLASKRRLNGKDAGLDPQIAAVLEYQRLMKMPPLESIDPVSARVFSEQNIGVAGLSHEPMAEIIDTYVGYDRVPVRIYVPKKAGPNWIVWNHGGGGVIGSIDGSEDVTRYIAANTGCTVASVGYRLGPEDKFPTAIDDAVSAFEALATRVPRGGRIAVGGDSYGGYLSVFVDQRTRDGGMRPPDLQILIYPVVDLTHSLPSIERNADGYLLTKAMIQWFSEHHLNSPDEQVPGSPWFWPPETLQGAAPAIVVTAGYDPLVDEGDAWAERLRAAGTPVSHHRYDSLIHGFISLGGVVRAARGALDDICSEIVEMLRQ